MNLSKYYAEICKGPVITKEQETDLFLELHDDGISEERKRQIKDQIIRSHLRFAFKKAKYFSKNDPGMFEELIAAGNEGLAVGLEKYDLTRGMRFLTYAGYWVDQRILKQMASMRIVSLPIQKQQLAARIQKFVDSHEGVTLDDLRAKFPEVSEKDLKDLFQTKYLTYYIEDLDNNPAFEINPIETEVERGMDRERLHSVVHSLPELHRKVIIDLYGLVDGVEKKQPDILKEYNLSKDRFKEVKREALEILKDLLFEDCLEEELG